MITSEIDEAGLDLGRMRFAQGLLPGNSFKTSVISMH